MDFLTSMRGKLGEAMTAAKKFAGSASMKRLTAVAAMVAYLPDKDADTDEIKRAIKAIYAATNGLYTIDEMNASIEAQLKTLKFDDEIGKAQLMNEIRHASGTEEAPILIYCGIAVGKASGPDSDPFTPAERALVAEIAQVLGEDSARYDLVKK